MGKDLKTLEGSNWLNDQVIHAYLSLLLTRYKGSIKAIKLESHFYTKLSRHGYQGVKNWTKRVDVLSKELVLIPVLYEKEDNWALVVIEIARNTLYHFDVLNGSSNGTECPNTVWVWLLKEAQVNGKEMKVEDWTFSSPEPQKLPRCLLSKLPMNFTQDEMKELRIQMAYELLKTATLTA